MRAHSLQGNTYFYRWYSLGVLCEAVQQDAGSEFIEEVKHSVARLAQPQAKLPQPALYLRGIWKIERRTVFPEHLDPGEEFGSRLFGQIKHPLPNRQSFIIFLEEIDAPSGRVFPIHIDSLSNMIRKWAIIIFDPIFPGAGDCPQGYGLHL